MKEQFKEFYKYSDEEIKNMWDNCIFVFDTNILLNLYRYDKSASDDLIKIFNEIYKQKRIWIPHQVGLEFHQKRIEVILDLNESYSKIKEIIENSFDSAKSKIDGKYHNNHPLLNLEKIKSEIDICKKDISKAIDKNEKEHPDWIKEDKILDEITKIFNGNIGEEYTKEKVLEIIKEGIDRFDNKIPPGYKDSSKEGDKKYGDLILWFQIIEMAKKCKKPIIFITEDNKSDWWLKPSGNTIGPRYELKREIKNKAEVDFYMYNSERFLEYASKYYGITIGKDSIEEVKRVSRSLRERNYIRHRIHSKINHYPFVYEFIIQQKNLHREFRNLMSVINLDEDIFFEFNKIQRRIIHSVESFNDEETIHSMMFEELLNLQEKIKRIFIDLIETHEMNNEQKKCLSEFIEKISESFMFLAQNFKQKGISGKYCDDMVMNVFMLRNHLRHF